MTPAITHSSELNQQLLPLAHRAPLFSGPVWLTTWLSHYWRSNDIFCLRAAELDGVCLVAPLMVRRSQFHRLPVRELRFLGTGDADHEEVVSEYIDITASHSQLSASWWPRIRDSLPPWDLLRAEAVQDNSFLAKMLADHGGWKQAHGFRYRLTLPASFEQWLAERSSRRREKFRRSLTQLADSHCIWQEGLRDKAALKALQRLHQSRWQSMGKGGAFASERFIAFHRQLLADSTFGAQICGWFRDQQPVALWYGFDHDGCRYFYQSGFDPQESQLRSPGEALHLGAIRSAIETGLSYYDFMRAPADSWKASFGATTEPLYDWILPGNSWRGRLINNALARQHHWQRVA